MAHLFNRHRQFNVEKNKILTSGTSHYKVEEFLGRGSYGVVTKCTNLDTKENVALKVISKDLAWTCRQEVATLRELRKLNKKCNMVEFFEHFQHKEHECLVFEMLDISLFDFMCKRNFKPLCLSEIRVITQQMLVALEALKSLGVAHADIKPDNVMLVNHKLQPFKLKLIDFGLAAPVSRFSQGRKIQALSYRAPEVMLGLKIDEGVDMWALGCVLAFLYLGQHLYPVCEYEVMRFIVKVHGTPGDHMLRSGLTADTFFTKQRGNVWRLNTRDEYKSKTGMNSSNCSGSFDRLDTLDDLVKLNKKVESVAEIKDTKAFISLLKCMLCVDPRKRITPTKGLGHRFITMTHFDGDPFKNDYKSKAHLTVEKSQLEQPTAEIKPYKTSSEVINNTLLSIVSWEDPPVVKRTKQTQAGRKAKTAGKKGQTQTTGNRAAAEKTVRPDREKEQKDSAGDPNEPSYKIKAANDKAEKKKKPISDDGFVEVRSRMTWLKRIGNFLYMLCFSCCRRTKS